MTSYNEQFRNHPYSLKQQILLETPLYLFDFTSLFFLSIEAIEKTQYLPRYCVGRGGGAIKKMGNIT